MNGAAVGDPVLAAFADEIGPTGPVAVRGGGSQWDVGGPLDPDTRIVDAPSGIVGRRPEEMVVHVRAGTAVAELHAALAEVGQTTALPELPGTTVGGTVAVGRSGIERLGRGQVRDAVLQVRYVSADGRFVTAGGPTVKNVSGFDLCRLLVGSLGTLGCLGDVMLRTRPIPEHRAWFRLDGAPPVEVHRAARTAASILWDGTAVWLLLAGYEVDVRADHDGLAGCEPEPVNGPPTLPPHRWSRRPAELMVLEGTGPFVAEAGVGVVHASEPDRRRALSPGVAALHRRITERFDPTGRLNPGRRPELV